jgi:hypothetical protein
MARVIASPPVVPISVSAIVTPVSLTFAISSSLRRASVVSASLTISVQSTPCDVLDDSDIVCRHLVDRNLNDHAIKLVQADLFAIRSRETDEFSIDLECSGLVLPRPDARSIRL